MYINIKKMRKALGMSQGQFAEQIGCGQTNVSFLEKNLRTTSEATYDSLVRAFGEEFVKSFEEQEPSTIIKGSTIQPTVTKEVVSPELLALLREQQRQTAELIELQRQTVSVLVTQFNAQR